MPVRVDSHHHSYTTPFVVTGHLPLSGSAAVHSITGVLLSFVFLACSVNSYQDDITIPWTSEWLDVGYTECLAEFRARRAAGRPDLKLLLFTQVQELWAP
jgi:hypothetical protein